MQKERRDPQSSYGLACLLIYVLVIIVDVPDDFGIGDKVNLTVVQCGYTGQDNRGTVSLDGFSVKVIFKIVVKIRDGDLFVGVVAHKVNGCQ